ncbi:hypothetical protein B566_EDAN008519 [Ephemera danica]|nr:hypothetical protein B566_EDAN008519 [Ephemera danica]
MFLTCISNMKLAIFLVCLVIIGTTTARHVIKRNDEQQNSEVKPSTSDVEKMVFDRLEMLETLLGDLYGGEGLLEQLLGNTFLVNKDTIKTNPSDQ